MGYTGFSLKAFSDRFIPEFASRRREPPVLEGEGAGLFIGQSLKQFLFFRKKLSALKR
jgi:hypothetical protein